MLPSALKISAILLVISLNHPVQGSPSSIRGLNPTLLPEYTQNSTHFHCLSEPHRPIPIQAINDDYCDCEDGSDEPGTSACEGRGGYFWCENKGHIPGRIGVGRVNDGICDDECCDGSDEWATGACSNRCEATGKEYRNRIESEMKTRKTGSKIRGTYVKWAVSEKKRLEDELNTKRVELTEKEAEVQRFKEKFESVEAKSHEVVERRKQSALYQTLLAQRTLLERLRSKTNRLTSEISDLHNILDELSKGYNPNYQDMAVKAAVVGYEELKKGSNSDEASSNIAETGSQGDDLDAGEKEKREEEVQDWELDQAERKDLESLLLEDFDDDNGLTEEEGILYKIDEYIPDFLFDTFDNVREIFVDWLVKLGIIGKGSKINTSGADDAPHVAAARQKHTDAQNEYHRLTRSIDETQETLDKLSGVEYGREGEWKKLDGTCVEKISGDYTYELCFFGRASQKSNKDYSNNFMGQFSSWDTNFESGSNEYYLKQAYRDGTKCWNGPNRSVDVELSCGVKNELLSVIEPEKCEYKFKVTTPALCLPLDQEPIAGKTEL